MIQARHKASGENDEKGDGGVHLSHRPVAFCVLTGVSHPFQMCRGGGRSPPISELPRDALVDHLIDLGGMPEELRDQTELVDYFLPPIRADYA